LSGGGIGSAQTICSGKTPATLISSSAGSGGTGTNSYLWQSSTDNTNWTTVSGATGTTYTPGALTTTTYYRRGYKNDCGTAYTGSVKITIASALSAGGIGSAQAICSGKTPATLTSSSTGSGGTGTNSYLWQSSTDNTNWTTVSGAAGTTYSPGALTTTTYYRRGYKNDCGTSYTTSVEITVYTVLSAGTIGSSQSICNGKTPAALTSSATASGGTGTTTYQWQSSMDNSTFTNISGATSTTYSPGALTTTTYYRRAASNTCGTVYTTSVKITVYAVLSAGTIGSVQSICNGKTPEQLSGGSPSGGAGGYTYQWEQSADGSAGWINVIGGSGATSASYTPPALTQTTWYRRKVTDSKCSYAYSSNMVEITVRHSSLYNYPDLRVRVCPHAGTSINLSKYIDTLDLKSGYPQWKSLSSVMIGASDGVISANSLVSQGIYTFTYTVSNPCTTSDITRKVYLEVLKDGRMRPFRDTIVICSDNAEAVNINQIFGIDANGSWEYYSWTADDVNAYVTESHSSKYSGAVVMNGKKIYNSNSIGSYTYHGISTKKVVFTYKALNASCLKGKSYTIVIILTSNLLE
jgi:hypothetical protein